MIPYYSPNFQCMDLLRTLACTKAFAKLEEFFQDLTGKQYILITSSCRAALYLAYKSLETQGLVHVSPLTCQVALTPIAASGNRIMFHDVKSDDWTLDPKSVEQGLQKDSLAIQAIHLGGFPCDMEALREIADSQSLLLIEDCAQGFGSSYAGQKAGQLGDISCFTLTKNVFGLGGGIFATDNADYYNKAKDLQLSFYPESRLKLVNRVLNAYLGSHRSRHLGEKVFQSLNRAKKKHLSKSEMDEGSLQRQLKKVPRLYPASVAARIKKIQNLAHKRSKMASHLKKHLQPLGFVFQENPQAYSAYTKLFCHHPGINSKHSIKTLNLSGLEAMHLEHKQDAYYQAKMTTEMQCMVHGDLKNYELVHDKLLSFPLYENMKPKDLEKIRDIAKRCLT